VFPDSITHEVELCHVDAEDAPEFRFTKSRGSQSRDKVNQSGWKPTKGTKLFIVEDWSLQRPLMMFIEKPVMVVAFFLACSRDRTYREALLGPGVSKESSAAFFRLKKGHHR
jgi:hypothetical protein